MSVETLSTTAKVVTLALVVRTETASLWEDIQVSLWHHLRGLFQFQAGLTDNPLGVLQLSLELAVFSGDLLEQLQRHSNTLVWFQMQHKDSPQKEGDVSRVPF